MVDITLGTIIKILEMVITFGESEIKAAKKEVDILVKNLSFSLNVAHSFYSQIINLSNKIDRCSDSEFIKEYEDLYLEYEALKTNPAKVDLNRTHCGQVQEDLDSVKMQLALFYRTDLSRFRSEWDKVQDILVAITNNDSQIINDYDKLFNSLSLPMDKVKTLIAAKNIAQAREELKTMAKSLQDDYKVILHGIDKMREANQRIQSF